ncbi:hypothetical protein EW146_g2266 [Bondarzewia mesenterica]|uniref:Mitochondrial intermembrane space import and assembly protein 40 n=1 Tax=Bondarzewia mesenterica TaxID=1095465 RepID=A0A4S4M1N0_9AGAM|nr:hypothetical protein EW146_g2266 [Bondarzewia mesenterica]
MQHINNTFTVPVMTSPFLPHVDDHHYYCVHPSRTRQPARAHERPWAHMATTYTWVVEQELAAIAEKTEETRRWAFEQRIHFGLGRLQPDPLSRQRHDSRRKGGENILWGSDLEAEMAKMAARSEEARRLAEEQEERNRALQEEFERMEERWIDRKKRMRQWMMGERKKVEDHRQRIERAEEDARQRMQMAWGAYEKRWTAIVSSKERLTFDTIPWPMVEMPRRMEDISAESVEKFVLSSAHSEGISQKDRIRNALRRWHPDRFGRLMSRVEERDRKIVEQGVGAVVRCLNELLGKQVSLAKGYEIDQSQNETNEQSKSQHQAEGADCLRQCISPDSPSKLSSSVLHLSFLPLQKMFRNVARISLKRNLHTAFSRAPSSSTSRYRLAWAVGGSVAATAYLTWHMNSDSAGIALDSYPSPKNSAKAANPESVDQPPEPASLESPASEPEAASAPEDSVPETEDEDGTSQGAFDPVTGKINWDCPCLGGMAYGPCGMQFREAFSCFVFSEQEPKGIDCVEKFKAMQDCFREHPETYGEEIMNDDEDENLDTSASAPVAPEGESSTSSLPETAVSDTSATPTIS